MTRFTQTDRWLLWAFLPLCALVLTLHVREVIRTGLAHPPIFVRPPAAADYPVVGGQRRERGMTWNDLQVGDRLIQVGDVDLRGVGYIGFDAIALEQAGTALRTPLVFEREGERHQIDLLMSAHTIPWFRLPSIVFLLGTALLVLLRSPGSRQSQLFFAAAAASVIFQAPFSGGPRLQTYFALGLFNFGGALAVFFILRWLIEFPPDVAPRDRLSRWWAALAGFFVVVRLPYLLDTPVPSEIVPALVLASDVAWTTLCVSIATWNYVHATPIGRRRMKWALYGGYVALSPLILAMLVAALAPVDRPEFAFHRMFQYSFLVAVALPIGLLIGIVRYNLFDVDRLISSTAAYSVSVVVLLGVGFAVVPSVARWLSGAIEVGETPLLAALSLALAGVSLPLSRRLRPQIDSLFFPERQVLRDGVERLLRDLSGCRTTRQVHDLMRDRLASLMRPESMHFLRRTHGGFSSSGAATSAIALRSPLVLELEGNPHPLPTHARELRRRVPNLPGADGLFLEESGLELLIPVRSGNDLAAIIGLGPRRSGDVYTTTDLGLLATVSERASAELSRLQNEHAVARERHRGDELEMLKDQAEKLNAARSRFLAAASHDLRQPLHALGLFVETLGDRLETEGDLAVVERMRRSTGGLGEMLDALLDMSRLDAGAIRPNVTAFALDPLLERLTSELAPLASQKAVGLVRDPTSAWVRSDPVLLARVVQNLLTNAVRYTEAGEVRVHCSSDASDVLIAVSDTGIGIPRERQDEIFGEFVKLSETGSGEGLGLGLSIVDRMAKLLGHEVVIDSKAGRGSTFTIRVPAVTTRATLRAPDATANFRGRLIVVLDDDLQVLEGTGSLLTQWGAEVVLAASLEDLLTSLRTLGRRPDAILLDYRLGGGGTGLDALEEIRSFLGAPVPAAVISGETASAPVAAIRASGLVHLTKPIPPFKLRAVLSSLMGNQDS